jgi:hypothetical protein
MGNYLLVVSLNLRVMTSSRLQTIGNNFWKFGNVPFALENLPRCLQYGQFHCWIWLFDLFSLVILNELTIQCVIRFGRFERILEHQWKC